MIVILITLMIIKLLLLLLLLLIMIIMIMIMIINIMIVLLLLLVIIIIIIIIIIIEAALRVLQELAPGSLSAADNEGNRRSEASKGALSLRQQQRLSIIITYDK